MALRNIVPFGLIFAKLHGMVAACDAESENDPPVINSTCFYVSNHLTPFCFDKSYVESREPIFSILYIDKMMQITFCACQFTLAFLE